MEFNNQNGAHLQNGTAAAPSKQVAQENAAKKDNNNATPKKDAASNKSEAKLTSVKDGKPVVNLEKPAEIDPLKQETNAEVVNDGIDTPKPVLTLEAKLKTVNDLHQRSLQRINLIRRMGQLEAFEVAQVTDELEENPYQGCTLIIRDDKGREFITSSPGLIRLVGQFIFNACDHKKAEIEQSIVFPNA